MFLLPNEKCILRSYRTPFCKEKPRSPFSTLHLLIRTYEQYDMASLGKFSNQRFILSWFVPDCSFTIHSIAISNLEFMRKESSELQASSPLSFVQDGNSHFHQLRWIPSQGTPQVSGIAWHFHRLYDDNGPYQRTNRPTWFGKPDTMDHRVSLRLVEWIVVLLLPCSNNIHDHTNVWCGQAAPSMYGNPEVRIHFQWNKCR